MLFDTIKPPGIWRDPGSVLKLPRERVTLAQRLDVMLPEALAREWPGWTPQAVAEHHPQCRAQGADDCRCGARVLAICAHAPGCALVTGTGPCDCPRPWIMPPAERNEKAVAAALAGVPCSGDVAGPGPDASLDSGAAEGRFLA